MMTVLTVNRRSILFGLIAAPVVVRMGLIMPVKKLAVETPWVFTAGQPLIWHHWAWGLCRSHAEGVCVMNADARMERSMTIESSFKKHNDVLWKIKAFSMCQRYNLESHPTYPWHPHNVMAMLNELDELINQADLK